MKIIAKKDLFINDEIRVREVRLVGLDGEQLGIKPLSEAQAIADDANVDLVLIQPQATPPVAKIMDYGKFKFEYQKKQKETVKPTGSNELLTVKLRYKAPDKDVSKKMELPFVDNKGNNVSSDFRFASAVAMFGQLLRNSDFKGDASYDKVIELAKQGLNNDDKGYRREFVRLVETAKGITPKD